MNLKEMRKILGKNQEEMACELGYTRSMYNFFENGKKKTPKAVFLAMKYLINKKAREKLKNIIVSCE